jgi:hypothetical protein
VNAHPGAGPTVLDKIIDNHFSDGGRINTTLVISDNQNFVTQIYKKKHKNYSKVGLANNQTASFKTGSLMVEEQGLYHNCLALLLNNSCDAIVVSIRPEEILKSGLPIDYFDHCIIDPESNMDSELINNSVQKLTGDNNLTDWLSKFTGLIEIDS